MSEPKKRIVLSRFWPGDNAWHVSDGSRCLILHVSFKTAALVPEYYCVFGDRRGEWCSEMELSAERTFPQENGVPVAP